MPSPSSVHRPAAPLADPLADPLAERPVALREDAPADGVTNMATDLALLRLARETGVTVLRLYGWSEPTVSVGRNERVAEEALARVRAAGLPIVRRPTGGRALLHDEELTYAVALPLPRGVGWRVAYEAVNERLVRALRHLGLDVTSAPPRKRGAGTLPTCFAGADDGELLVNGRKLVGSAVWREGHAYLQHGSLLLRDGQARLETLLADEGARGDRRAAGDVPGETRAAAPLGADGLAALLAARGQEAPVDALRRALAAAFAATPAAAGVADLTGRVVEARSALPPLAGRDPSR